MKKQLKRISKKIIIYSLIGSLTFTSVFSTRKIETKAASFAAYLSAWTLYEICLYIGGLAVTALGIGYAYDNRDEIAEFGKSVIDSMTDVAKEGWMIGCKTAEQAYVYGAEAFQSVKDSTWEFIQSGGLTPSTAADLTGDGYVDISDRDFELTQTKYWTTADGMEVITSHLKGIYDDWVNKEADNVLEQQYGVVDAIGYDGSFPVTSSGRYCGLFEAGGHTLYVEGDFPFAFAYDYVDYDEAYTVILYCSEKTDVDIYVDGEFYRTQPDFLGWNMYNITPFKSDFYNNITSNLPMFSTREECQAFLATGNDSSVINREKSYRVADWIDQDGAWMDTLEGIAAALRPLQDVSSIADELADAALALSATADIYRDLAMDLVDEYVPAIDAVLDPVYWPDTNTAPPLDIADLPNADVANPDIPMPDVPGSEDPDDPNNENKLDLGGLLNIFTILIYIVMIIIMLIYLFLACLAFIVMIFRIPASSSMLPEEMVMGFEHLQTIMIPGMNISIYDFAMALIYMFIVFAVIKVLRHEINHFNIPRAFK